MASTALKILDTKAVAYGVGALVLVDVVYVIGRRAVANATDFAVDVVTYPFQEYQPPEYHDLTSHTFNPWRDSIFEGGFIHKWARPDHFDQYGNLIYGN